MTIVVVAVADANPGIDGDVDASVMNFLFHPRARDRWGANQRRTKMRWNITISQTNKPTNKRRTTIDERTTNGYCYYYYWYYYGIGGT